MSPRALSILPLALLLLSGCEESSSRDSTVAITRFTRTSPQAVFLAGEFNDWSATATPMRREGSDRWIVDLPLRPGKYQYKFVVDGQWERDVNNPATAPDGWGGLNSVVTVSPAAAPGIPPQSPVEIVSSEAEKKKSAAPLGLRKEVRWNEIWYPRFPIPGAEEREITGFLRGGTRDIAGQAERLRFTLLFSQAADQPLPEALARPEEFVVQLHLPDGQVIPVETPDRAFWGGAGNQQGTTYSRQYRFPWTRNAYDEAWIEWRLRDRAFWFEVPYGFTRDPTQPWPPPEMQRSEPHLAPALQDLASMDRLVPWRFVEYDLGEIPNSVWLSVRLANPFYPAAEVILHDNDFVWTWTAENPRTAIQFKGGREGRRVAFRTQGRLDRLDTFRLVYDGSDAGRENGVVIVRVDDRSYEFTVPSSLFKDVHGRADYEHPRRLPESDDLFERLVRLAD